MKLSIALTGLVAIALCASSVFAQAEKAGEQTKSGLELLQENAQNLQPLVSSELGTQFLSASTSLPSIETRQVLVNKEDRSDAIALEQGEGLDEAERVKYEIQTRDENDYYFTRYGSPLAFVRPLEVAAEHIGNPDGKRICDFGFGTIGHLRILASLGADVTGIEVDMRLKAMYSDPDDIGDVAGASDSVQGQGRLNLLFGSFPTELTEESLDGQFDLFVSKNTLKRGYIHPDREVNPRMLVHLGCDDSTFVTAVYQKLKTGGLFYIYNLHPAPSADDQPYKPWADGRCPFERDVLENAGFEVIAFDVDDSISARQMGAALGWDEQMDLETDLFATYTLVRKK